VADLDLRKRNGRKWINPDAATATDGTIAGFFMIDDILGTRRSGEQHKRPFIRIYSGIRS
jgi:hypothetical protein